MNDPEKPKLAPCPFCPGTPMMNQQKHTRRKGDTPNLVVHHFDACPLDGLYFPLRKWNERMPVKAEPSASELFGAYWKLVFEKTGESVNSGLAVYPESPPMPFEHKLKGFRYVSVPLFVRTADAENFRKLVK